jgi:hypothetical protein
MNEDCSEGPSRDHARKVTGDRNRRLGEKVPLQLRTVSPGRIATIYEYYIIKNKLKYRQEVAEPARPSRSVWPPNELSRGQTGSVSTPGQGRGGDGRSLMTRLAGKRFEVRSNAGNIGASKRQRAEDLPGMTFGIKHIDCRGVADL